MLAQLVYMSAATCLFDEVDLSVLLAKARERNESLEVTGMLLYHDGSFLQALEGDGANVDALYTRIARDPRHAQCQLLLRSSIAKRDFGGWNMGFANARHPQFRALPGFNDFFGRQFDRRGFLGDSSLPHKLLLAFRDGAWRQKVENGSLPAVTRR